MNKEYVIMYRFLLYNELGLAFFDFLEKAFIPFLELGVVLDHIFRSYTADAEYDTEDCNDKSRDRKSVEVSECFARYDRADKRNDSCGDRDDRATAAQDRDYRKNK